MPKIIIVFKQKMKITVQNPSSEPLGIPKSSDRRIVGRMGQAPDDSTVRGRSGSRPQDSFEFLQEFHDFASPVGEGQDAALLRSCGFRGDESLLAESCDLLTGMSVTSDVLIDLRLEASGMLGDIEQDIDGVGALQNRAYSCFAHRNHTKVGNMGSRPLNSGNPFAVQVSGELRSLNAGADVLVCSRSVVRSTLSSFVVRYLQLLMSLIATMIAMTTMRMTRMMSR